MRGRERRLTEEWERPPERADRALVFGVKVAHHDVFISYSREDRAKVEKIANALAQRGLHVWWDPKIKTGAGFREEISEALSSTRTVLVIWSRYSVASRFVADEADEGAAREILFPALIDNVDIPLGFRQIQTADLTHWRGNLNDNAFKAFIDAVHDGAMSRQQGKKSSQPPAPAEPTPAPDENDPEPEKSPPPLPPKPATKPEGKSPLRKTARYTTTGSKRRLALFGQSMFMAALIAAAFGALAYASDFVFPAYRPLFIGIMAVLAFLSRYGTLEADRAAGAASLALLPRSYIALILFSLISIAPLVLEGRLYAAALEGVQVKGIEGADINNVTFDRYAERIITSADDNTAKLWEAATGVERAQFTGHRENCAESEGRCWVWSADFSPDGMRAVSASRDMTAIIWSTEDGALIDTLKGHRASVYDVAWHPGGDIIATASSDHDIRIWDAGTGETIRTLSAHSDNVNAIDFNPAGNLLAAASDDGMATLWNWETGQRLSTLPIGGAGNDVRFSNSGDRLVAAASNGRVRVWDTSSRARIRDLEHGAERAFAAVFINNDEMVATSGIDPVIRFWDVSTGELVRELEGHKSGIRGLDSSADGMLLVSGSRDNTARVWNAETGENRITMGHIKSAIDLPMALDTPPAFVSSQAPVPVNFQNDPSSAASMLAKGVSIGFVILIAALILKGFFWIIGARTIARAVVVTVLMVICGYLSLLIASTLPAEALALWLTIAFIPATVLALLRWIWRATILRNLNPRTRKPA